MEYFRAPKLNVEIFSMGKTECVKYVSLSNLFGIIVFGRNYVGMYLLELIGFVLNEL